MHRFFQALDNAHRFYHIRLHHSEQNIIFMIGSTGALDDHIDIDIGICQSREDFICHTRFIADTANGDLGNISIVRYAANNKIFLLHCVFLPNNSSGYVVKGRTYMDSHAVMLAIFDGARLHDAGAQTGQLQHFHKSDLVQLLRSGYDTGIGSINAVHISIDIAHICLQTCCDSHSGSIAAAASQSSYLAIVSNALEPCHDNDLTFVQGLPYLLGLNVQDTGFRVLIVSFDTRLRTGKRYRRLPFSAESTGHQGNRNLLACCQQHIQLPFWHFRIDFSS